MASLIGSLRVTLGIDSAQFEQGSKRARQQAQQDATAIQKSFKTVREAYGRMAAGISTGLLIGAARSALDYASSLGEVAQQLGVTTKDLQTLRYAATQTGVSQEALDKGLGRLTLTLGQVAVGAEKPRKALESIGISARELSGKTTGEAFRMIAEGLGKVDDRAKRAAVEVAIFGKAGAQLDTMLAGGREELDALAGAAERMGIVLSDEQIQNADATADKLADLQQVLQARIAGVVSQNADSILTLATALSNVAAAVVDFLASDPARAYALMTALGGAAIAGPKGGLVGAVVGYTYGKFNTPEGIKARLTANSKNFVQQYLRNGGTMEEIKSGRINREVLKKPGVMALYKERKDLESLANPAIASPDPGPSADLADFMAKGGGKGGRGKSAEQLAREAERQRKDALREAYDFASDQRRNNIDILRAQADLLPDLEDRHELEKQILDLEREQERASLKLAVDMGEMSAAQAATLNAQLDKLDGLRRDAMTQERMSANVEESARLADVDLDLQRGMLEQQSSLARTAKERRELELQILGLTYRQDRTRLEAVLADERSTWVAKEEARRRLASIDARQANDRESVMRGTMGPLESYLDSIPKTAEEIDEAFQEIKANGLNDVIEGLTEAGTRFVKLGGIAGQVVNGITADLLRLNLQQTVLPFLSNLIGMGPAAGNAKAAANFGAQAVARYGSLIPRWATGGGGRIGGMAGVDSNILSINGSPVARVSRGEMLNVSPANDMGRAPIVISVEEGSLFRPTIRSEAAGVSVQTVYGAQRAASKRASRRL